MQSNPYFFKIMRKSLLMKGRFIPKRRVIFLEMEIEELIERISSDLQMLQRKFENGQEPETNIIFPSGVIRKAWRYREIIPFIKDDSLCRNISYHLMVDDIFHWLLTRFNLYLVAEALLIKIAIANFGAIFEAMVKVLAEPFNKKKAKKKIFETVVKALTKTFSKMKTKRKKTRTRNEEMGVNAACTILVKKGIISKETKKNIRWVWNIRNKQHLVTLKKWEYERYERSDYDKTISIFNKIIAELNSALEEGKLKI